MKSINSKESMLVKVASASRSVSPGWLSVAVGAAFGRCSCEFPQTLCRVVVVRGSTSSLRIQSTSKGGFKGCFFI